MQLVKGIKSKVHVHPFGIKPFVFNYHLAIAILYKSVKYPHMAWGGGCVCMKWKREFCKNAPVENVAPLTPKPCSPTEHMSVSRDCRQSKRDGTEQGL